MPRLLRQLVVSLGLAATVATWAGPTDAPADGLAYAYGWQDEGGEFGPGEVRVRDGVVHVGAMARAIPGRSRVVAFLPPGARPQGRLAFHLMGEGAGARIDVMPDGTVHWLLGGAATWQSLAGIAFPIEAEPLVLDEAWVAYARGYGLPGLSRRGAVVHLTGLIKGPTRDGTRIAVLPEGARPPRTVRIQVNQHEVAGVIDIQPDGQILLARSNPHRGWVSLDGIVFSTTPGAALDLARGVSAPSRGDAPQAHRHGGEVVLSGRVRRTGDGGAVLLTLPAGHRPGRRLIFAQPTDLGEAQVDVHPDGRVTWEGGPGAEVSLAGLCFALP